MAQILYLVVLIGCAMQVSQAAFGLPSFIPIPKILGGNMPKAVTAALESARAKVNDVGAAVQGQVQELVDTIDVAAGSVQAQAEKAIQTAADKTKEMTKKATEDATNKAAEAKKAADDMIKKATEDMPKTAETKKEVDDMTKKAKEDMTKAVESAKQCAETQISKVDTVQSGAVKGITSCVKESLTVAKDSASEIMGNIKLQVEGVQKAMQALDACTATGSLITQGICSARATVDLGMKSASTMSAMGGVMSKVTSSMASAQATLLKCVGGQAVGSVKEITALGKEAVKGC